MAVLCILIISYHPSFTRLERRVIEQAQGDKKDAF